MHSWIKYFKISILLSFKLFTILFLRGCLITGQKVLSWWKYIQHYWKILSPRCTGDSIFSFHQQQSRHAGHRIRQSKSSFELPLLFLLSLSIQNQPSCKFNVDCSLSFSSDQLLLIIYRVIPCRVCQWQCKHQKQNKASKKWCTNNWEKNKIKQHKQLTEKNSMFF